MPTHIAGIPHANASMPDFFSHPYISGIGGIGTSGLALWFLDAGIPVRGSDLRPSVLTDALTQRGADIAFCTRPDCVQNASCLVIPSHFPSQHPEVKTAREAGIPVLERTRALAEICRALCLQVTLCFGTLSRAHCALSAAFATHSSYCTGAVPPNGAPHACLDSKRVILDVDERDFIRDPDLCAAFSPRDILISDWQNEALGYYTAPEPPDRFAKRFDTKSTRIYPIPDQSRTSLAFVMEHHGCRSEWTFEVHPTPSGGLHCVPPVALSPDAWESDGTLSDCQATAAAMLWTRKVAHTSPADTVQLAPPTGWFASVGPRQFLDIRMHPVGVRSSVQTLARLAQGKKTVVAIRPFISTLTSYPIDFWQKAFNTADQVVILTPPYEGCSTESAETFCHQLRQAGLAAESMTQPKARELAARGDAFWLWIGAPDVFL